MLTLVRCPYLTGLLASAGLKFPGKVHRQFQLALFNRRNTETGCQMEQTNDGPVREQGRSAQPLHNGGKLWHRQVGSNHQNSWKRLY